MQAVGTQSPGGAGAKEIAHAYDILKRDAARLLATGELATYADITERRRTGGGFWAAPLQN